MKRLFRGIGGLFSSPWVRIWLLCSFLWMIGFNVWAYQRWEKMAAVTKMLMDQEIEAIDKQLPDGLPAYRQSDKWDGSKLKPYLKLAKKKDVAVGVRNSSEWRVYWWWDSFSGWLGVNTWWYCIWCFGPVGVGLITIIGTKWIIRGFKEKT